MRIATYNIHGWRTMDDEPNLDAVAATLRSIDADIVGLNEVFYPRVVAGSQQPALEALATRLGLHFVFGPCLRWPVQDDMPADAYGNALLSRRPIIASAAHHLTPKEPELQAAVTGKEPRGLLEGRILLPDGRTFTVYVTHLDHTDEQARLAQLRTLRTWTGRDRNRPHAVIGDFNAINPWDWDEERLAYLTAQAGARGGNLIGSQGPQVIAQMEKAGYVDAYRHCGRPGQATFLPSTDKSLRIDYIFLSKPLAPALESCTIRKAADGREASDHLPVVADIAF